MAEWWREFYPRLYALLGEDVADPKRTSAEVEWIWQTAGLQDGQRILDVGCGAGRHAIELARRGAQVHGVDVSEALIAAGRQRAVESSAGAVSFEILDIRQIGSIGGQPYHAAVMMDSVSGILDRDETCRVLAAVGGLLRGAGCVLLSQTHADWLQEDQKVYSSQLDNGALMQRRFTFDRQTRRLSDQVLVIGPEPGQREVLPMQSLQLYAEDEIKALLEQAGFGDVRICEDPLEREGEGGGPSEMYVTARVTEVKPW